MGAWETKFSASNMLVTAQTIVALQKRKCMVYEADKYS